MKTTKRVTGTKGSALNCFTGKKISNIKATKSNKFSLTYITESKFPKQTTKGGVYGVNFKAKQG